MSSVAQRPQLDAALDYLRDGDVLVITKLDRLARSVAHLVAIGERLEEKGVALRVLDQAIDTSTPTGRLMFNMLGAIAQFETELRAERQMDGIRKARERGVHLGRHKRLTPQQIAALQHQRREGALIKTLMYDYRLSKASVYRYLGHREAAPSIQGGQTA